MEISGLRRYTHQCAIFDNSICELCFIDSNLPSLSVVFLRLCGKWKNT